MDWRPLILNRFALTFGAIAAAIFAWNVYVAMHDGGRLAGVVVDSSGKPVAGAKVVLGRQTVASIESVAETQTNANGRFTFNKHGQYSIVLTASAPGAGKSDRLIVPLWFRNQDLVLSSPLILKR